MNLESPFTTQGWGRILKEWLWDRHLGKRRKRSKIRKKKMWNNADPADTKGSTGMKMPLWREPKTAQDGCTIVFLHCSGIRWWTTMVRSTSLGKVAQCSWGTRWVTGSYRFFTASSPSSWSNKSFLHSVSSLSRLHFSVWITLLLFHVHCWALFHSNSR